MIQNEQRDSWFRHDLYRRATDEIMSLKARLPMPSVEILAREVLSRLAARVPGSPDDHRTATEAEVAHLAGCLISDDAQAGRVFVDTVRADGVSPEDVYLSYLAGAARQLGAWWDDDRVTFVQVTLGTGRIYAIMRAMGEVFARPLERAHPAAVFASVPGETHTLGVTMAADLFRKDGWDVDLLVGRSHGELVEAIQRSGHRLIGLSAGGAHAVSALARLVVALRVSCPKAFIMASGNVVHEADDIMEVLGVDGVATDMPGAQRLMRSFWAEVVESAAAPKMNAGSAKGRLHSV